MNQWGYQYKDDYQYDNNDNRSLGTYYEWIETPGELAPYYKDEFIFDLAFDFNDLIGPFNYDDELDDITQLLIKFCKAVQPEEKVPLMTKEDFKAKLKVWNK